MKKLFCSLSTGETSNALTGNVLGNRTGANQSAFDILLAAFRKDPDRDRLTFLSDDGSAQTVNGRAFIARAEWLGKQLLEVSEPGDRVLLAYPAGIEFVVAFLACVRAGVIPVPVPYPKPRRTFSRYESIALDSGATIGLTNLETLQKADSSNDSATHWISPEPWPGNHMLGQLEEIDAETTLRPDPEVLFLQYTSGSTGVPKGVCVTLENVMANLQVIGRGFGLDQLERDQRVVCSWLPAYHDMGLVGVILSSLVYDGHAVLMSPTSFMQHPGRWLNAISDYRATITVAPCFSYRYTVAKVSDDEIEGLDLSGLTVAACGAEPIVPDVLDAFATRFESAGFRRNVFYPCYGLAESTLMVTGANRNAFGQTTEDLPGYKCRQISRVGLRNSVAESPAADADQLELVSSGVPDPSTVMRIVDPNTLVALQENQVGEVWVDSASVAQGYWQRPDITKEVFGASLPYHHGTFLRTGDLGFLSEGELYVTGRSKDLIIIRGQNHYPEDIERSVIVSSDGFSDCLGAAFSIPEDDGDSLVVCQEVPRRFSQDQSVELLGKIRLALASDHDLIARAIILIRFASMPRTSSGKVQRSQCRQMYLDDSLKVIAQSQQSISLDPSIFPDLGPVLASADRSAVQQRIERVLVKWLVDHAGMDKYLVDAQKPFAECGIDSLMAVEMSGQLERWLSIRLSPVIAWSHPNAERLAHYLTTQVLGPDAPTEDYLQGESDNSIEAMLASIESMSEEKVLKELDGMGSDPDEEEGSAT